MQYIEDKETGEKNLKVFQERYGLEFMAGGTADGRTSYKDGFLNYKVLDTDYENYSVVYACDNWLGGIYHSQNAWILSRTPYMTPTVFAKAQSALKAAAGDSVNLEDLTFTGLECGWERCSTDSIIDLSIADPSL